MTAQLENNVDSLNSLLRGELSAIESYEYALARYAGQGEESTLQRICDDHRHAVEMLREHVEERGEEPSLGSGPWGYFTAAVTGTAKLMGPETTLAALRRGEEHGERSYEDTLADGVLSEECLEMISAHLLPRIRIHMETLDRLISVARPDPKIHSS